jgi:hypothetical protein
VTLVGSEPALVASKLAFVSGAPALRVFDRACLLVRAFNRSLFKSNY